MIRVCLVAPCYMTGGQAIEARTIANGFATGGECRVELQPIDPRIPAWLARIRGARTIARWPLFIGGLLGKLRRADVLHVCTAAYWPFLLTTTPAILIARLLGHRVVLNYRDGRAPHHLRSRWVRWVIRRADLLVFPSGFLRDVFREWDMTGEVVDNVVNLDRFRFRERRPLRPVLLSCRLLEPLYAVENTIRAFEILRRRYSEARLLVIGGGEEEGRLRRMVQDAGIPGVEFHGMVAHTEVPDWFDRADILVNSSREDNMPHSLIEAFSSGLPVVSTNAGGIPYIVDDGRNGLLVPIDEPEALAGAVIRLLEDPQLSERLIAQALADCRARYSWEAARSGWLRLYRSLLASPVRGRSLIRAGAE